MENHLGPVRWNGAIFHDRWKKFQFAFLGANSFTEIHNARDAVINGIETDASYIRGGLTLNAAAAYTDAKTKGISAPSRRIRTPTALGWSTEIRISGGAQWDALATHP